MAFVALSVLVVVAVALRLGAHPPTRVVLAGWLPIVAVAALAAVWLGEGAARDAQHRLRALVEGMAPTYALELGRAGHARVGLETAADDPLYLSLVERQRQWLDANRAIADVYTFRRRADGAVVLIVDSETDYDHDGAYAGDREARTAIGEVYPDEDVDDTLRVAFDGVAGFMETPSTDRWGTWVSAWVPMRDADGRVEAVLGVDFPADEWVAAASAARRQVWALGGSAVCLLAVGALVAGEAIRERRRREDEVARLQVSIRDAELAVRAAEDAVAERTMLLRTVSHEIRNPLTGVIGMSELLLDTRLDNEQRHCAETVHRSGHLLLQTLDGVLDFAKLEAGAMEYESLATDLRDLVGITIQLFGEPARRKGTELAARVDADVPDGASLDPTRLRQVLVNLVSNGVKFTQGGEVELHVARTPTSLRFAVRDSGVGIEADRLPTLFAPFVQAHGAETARRYGGSGLGLSICKGLVEGMGGTLSVRSAPGAGTTFTVELPLRDATTDAARRAMFSGRTVLVVEPRPMVAAAVGSLLAAHGARVVVAADVVAGRKAVGTLAPDVVLAEAGCVDGLRGVGRLKRLIPTTTRPVSGRDELVLHRPISAQELRRVLGEAFSTKEPVRERTMVPITVLVIEPNAVNQGILAAVFRSLGAGVDTLANAGEAAKALGGQPYDLAFLGPSVEGGEGRTLVEGLRRAAPSVPLVAVASVAGVNAMVNWPLRVESAQTLLRRWIPSAFTDE